MRKQMNLAVLSLIASMQYVTAQSPSNIVFEETFSAYQTGDAIEKESERFTGVVGGWSYASKTSEASGTSPVVVDEPLVYPGYIDPGKGKSILFDPTVQGGMLKGENHTTILRFANKPLSKEKGENIIYISFLIRIGEDFPPVGNTDIFAFIKQGKTDGANVGFRSRLAAKITQDKIIFGIQKTGKDTEGNPIPFAFMNTRPVPKSQTALLVIKYIHNGMNGKDTDHPDKFYLFINPDPGKSEADNQATCMEAAGNDFLGGDDLRYICFRQRGITQMKIGGVRIAKTFESVFTGQ